MPLSVTRKTFTRVVAPVAVAASAIAIAVPASTASTAPRPQHTVSSRASSQGTWGSHVVGSFGKSGRVTGHFMPLRSYVRNGVTVVQGDLRTTLRRSTGQLVGHAVRHDVVLPIHASGAHTAQTAAAPSAAQAACTILHLVLGPLDLNLLGLKVHLNRVVLDITAHSGSGNLLGNLLCAVAHLLDNANPTSTNLLQLSSLLNRIIGILS
jgi:hypothetical protein